MPRSKKPQPVHHAADFDLDISDDGDLFRWFLLVYFFGKPIQSAVGVQTWRLFVEEGLDTPWNILAESERSLVRVLYRGKYAHYADSTAHGLHQCMEQLMRGYEGSLLMMADNSADEDEFAKRLKQLHGVGPKTAEIFMRETGELFARRVE